MVLQYHSGDKYATKLTEAKVQEYKVGGFPSMFFNGGNSIIGGSDRSYDQYSKMVSKELSKGSQINIAGELNHTNGDLIDATVTNTGINEIKSITLMVVVYQDLGTSEHHYVVRDILPPVSITSLPSQISQKFSFKSGITGSAFKAVLFLQSLSGEILQSTLVNLGL